MITSLLLAISFLFTTGSHSPQNNNQPEPTTNKKIDILQTDALINHLDQSDAKVLVVNLWASWCGPCVKEMPHFDKVGTSLAGKGVEVLFVSLDFPKVLTKKVLPLIERKQIESRVLLWDMKNNDRAIKTFNEAYGLGNLWDGALPATLVLSKSRDRAAKASEFLAGEVSESALKALIKKHLKNTSK